MWGARIQLWCPGEDAGHNGLCHGDGGGTDGGPGGAIGGFVAGDGVAGTGEFEVGVVREVVAASVDVLVEVVLEADAVVGGGVEVDVVELVVWSADWVSVELARRSAAK